MHKELNFISMITQFSSVRCAIQRVNYLSGSTTEMVRMNMCEKALRHKPKGFRLNHILMCAYTGANRQWTLLVRLWIVRWSAGPVRIVSDWSNNKWTMIDGKEFQRYSGDYHQRSICFGHMFFVLNMWKVYYTIFIDLYALSGYAVALLQRTTVYPQVYVI